MEKEKESSLRLGFLCRGARLGVIGRREVNLADDDPGVARDRNVYAYVSERTDQSGVDHTARYAELRRELIDHVVAVLGFAIVDRHLVSLDRLRWLNVERCIEQPIARVLRISTLYVVSLKRENCSLFEFQVLTKIIIS
jgi:hypothetical protein